MNGGQSSVPLEVGAHAVTGRAGEAVREPPGATSSDSDAETAVRPLLEAAVRMAGAAAAKIRMGRGAFAIWCGQCPDSRNPDSDCVRDQLCGAGDAFTEEPSGQVCRHIVTVPLRCGGAPVGTLDLHFDEECALPAQTISLLGATGELIGTCLENARLMRENLHAAMAGERQMMANEVHDSLAQGLTYMRMRMSMLRDSIKQGDELRAFKYWNDVDGSLTNAHARLREIITYFRSRMDPQGLQHALTEIAGTFFDRTGITLEFANLAPDLHLTVEREVQAYHIVHEALANVCRHAKAGRVTLSLDRKGDFCEIAVADDGVGVPHEAENADLSDAGHYGIAIMRERTRRLGGELAIERAVGAGTRVFLRFPLDSRRSRAGHE